MYTHINLQISEDRKWVEGKHSVVYEFSYFAGQQNGNFRLLGVGLKKVPIFVLDFCSYYIKLKHKNY